MAINIKLAIQAQYPDATPGEIREAIPDLIKYAYQGSMPPYSSLEAPTLHKVKTATVGSFVICYGMDTSVAANTKREPSIVLIKRGDKGFGITGGYTELGKDKTSGEQPKEGAVRELKEEVLDNNGTPIISPDSERLKLIVSGIDYRNPELPVNYNGHTLELTTQELLLLKEHSRRLNEESAYQADVTKKTHGEVDDLQIVPISNVLAMKRESFTHPHEFDAIRQFAQTLQQQSFMPRR